VLHSRLRIRTNVSRVQKRKIKEIFGEDKPTQKIEQIVTSVQKGPTNTVDYYYRNGDYSYFRYTKKKFISVTKHSRHNNKWFMIT